MKNLFNTLYLFVLLLFFSLDGHAQLYPVQLTPVFNSPYSVKISDYATSMDTKMQLLINPTDVSITNRQVRLKLYIQGNGLNIQSSDFIQGQRPIFINGGELQTLTNTDIGALFRFENLQGITAAQYANNLPEGMYSFCFELFDYVTNQKISQKSCASLYLILNDPPLLNTPLKNVQIAATEFPNIAFTWTPRQINATNVSYKFELKQLIDPTIDPQFGFQMAPLLYEETLFGTALLYNLSMPILTPGMRYAWRVKAISTTGLSENAVFKNDGYSEIFSFKYTASCTAPTFLMSEAQGTNSVRINWQGLPEHTRYQIQYKKQNVPNAEWFSAYSLNTQSMLTNLEPGVTYQFRIGSSCDPVTEGVQSFTYSTISTFTTPTQTNGVPAYNCGIIPKVNIQNQKPIENLIESETFTAGDFPVTVLKLEMERSPYTGLGYIIVPYLNDTKIAVGFKDIIINTDYQLISGVVETTYDPNWGNVKQINHVLQDAFGSQVEIEDVAVLDDPIILPADNTFIDTNDESTEEGIDDVVPSESNAVNETPQNGQNTENEIKQQNNTEETQTNSQNNDGIGTGNPPANEGYFIEYNSKKYYNGDIIAIPYNRNLLNHKRFKMGEIENGVNIKYELNYESEKGVRFENAGGNNYVKKFESADNSNTNFDFTYDNTLKYKLNSKADLEKNPSLSNDINLIVNPSQLKFLKATDNYKKDSKRIAYAPETLYYVDKSLISSQNKRTTFLLGMNIPIEEVPPTNMKWKINDTYDQTNEGKYTIEIFCNDEKKDGLVSSVAGYPTASTKSVRIKWINKNAVAWNFVPPAISQALTKSFEEVGGTLTKMDKYIKISRFLKFKIDPIKINGSKYNEEDEDSRLYKKMEVASISGGFSAESPEKTFSIPPLQALSRAGIVDIGLYFKASFGVEVEGGVERYILAEQKNYHNTKKPTLKIGPKGSITAGIKAELLIARDQVKFDVKGGAEASLKGDISYNFSDKKFVGELYFPPIILFANVQIETKGFIEFELVDYQKSIEITDKFTLYEYTKQF